MSSYFFMYYTTKCASQKKSFRSINVKKLTLNPSNKINLTSRFEKVSVRFRKYVQVLPYHKHAICIEHLIPPHLTAIKAKNMNVKLLWFDVVRRSKISRSTILDPVSK